MSGTYDAVGGGQILVKCEKQGPEPWGCALTVMPLSPPASTFLFFGGWVVPSLIVVIAFYLNFVLNSVVAIFVLSVLVVLQVFFRLNRVKEETVLLIPTVGLQYTKKLISGNQIETFIHWRDIKSIIINEVIYRQKIVYLLTVIVNDSLKKNMLLPLFIGTLPRLKCLEILYQELMDILDKR